MTRLAHRVVYEINRVTPVTATSLAAMALLTNPRRGSTYVDFVRSAERLAARLTAAGARFATTLRAKEGTLRTEGLRGAVELLAQAGLVQIHGDGEDAIYGVPDERRMGLDYYKNGLLHFFVSEALVATALLAPPSGPIAHGALRERVQRLSRLFKFEFMFRADAPFEVVFDQTLDAMAASGEVETLGGHVTVVQGDGAERVRLYARLVRNFLEGYRATASALEILLKGPLPAREFGRRALAHAHRLYLSGQVSLREACTRPVIDNATLAMKDRGVLEGGDEEAPLALGAAYASAEAVRAVAQSIGAYLTEAS